MAGKPVTVAEVAMVLVTGIVMLLVGDHVEPVKPVPVMLPFKLTAPTSPTISEHTV